jgi:hypothetical protein
MRLNSILRPAGVLALLPLLMLISCDDDDDAQPRSEPVAVYGQVEVTVEHPQKGTGPDFIVKVFKNLQDVENNEPWDQAETNKDGIARFKEVPIGETVVNCRVPSKDSTAFFAQDTIEVATNEQTDVTLKLRHQ